VILDGRLTRITTPRRSYPDRTTRQDVIVVIGGHAQGSSGSPRHEEVEAYAPTPAFPGGPSGMRPARAAGTRGPLSPTRRCLIEGDPIFKRRRRCAATVAGRVPRSRRPAAEPGELASTARVFGCTPAQAFWQARGSALRTMILRRLVVGAEYCVVAFDQGLRGRPTSP